ncbi:hypothetical protein C1645_473403 [Glomus cerebriforme]|uniref:Protein kinase domain-containing protein n=1 Tax=Glomus cerebriforme TaxID=658196 RepID=A0A397SA56_9GLOM|nr:hypothetical protein C1645_473403 [Glomus cerebriforme]
MIMQGYIDSGKSSPPSNLISSGDHAKSSRRTTPPEMSPPHFSPELNHSLPFNNNEERRYNNFAGGFNPVISERWKALQPEGLSPLSEESQDISKFRELKDVTFPVPHYDSSQQQGHAYSLDHKTPSYRAPSNYSPYIKNHRRSTSHDRDNLNYSNSSSSQHRVGGVDYSRNNVPLKLRSQPPPSSKHPPALQPANGMRRPPSHESIIRNTDNNIRNPPPPPIPPKPNSVPQKSQQQPLMPIHSGGVYMHPQHKYNSKSQPHLPLSQKSTTINSRDPPESERSQHTIHAVISEPDLTFKRPEIWQPVSQSGKEFSRPPIVQPVQFPEDDDEPPLWPKITLSSQSKEEDDSFWAEKPKPSSQIMNPPLDDDENSFWAEVPISNKKIITPNELIPSPQNDKSLSHINDGELPTRTSSITSSIEPLRKSFDRTNIEDIDNAQKPRPPSKPKSTSNDDGGDEDFWARKPISSKSRHLPIGEVAAADDDQNQKNSGQSTNSTIDEAIDSSISLNSVHNQNNKLSDNDNNDNQEQNRKNIKSHNDINESGNNDPNSSSEGIQSNSSHKSSTPKRQRGPSGLARTVSLRRGVKESWVVRPTAEDLFEQLEQYFPGHDLDKPIVDANGSSVQQSNNNEESQSVPTVPEKPGGKIQRGKSIRAAAREAHEREQREKKERNKKVVGVFNTIIAKQRLSRKPTTKLWDKKIVYVPSHKKPCPPDVPPGECVSAERKPVIWVKGELIGKGTFGKVFLAMNVNSSEIMAVKQIELPTTKSDRLNERQLNLVKSFTDEMEILKDLDHEHIVQYIGFERNEEAINIFLEYVNGGSIGTCLRIYGAFKEPVVRSFTRQILLGLQYLHNKGILHRDIKADNILVDEEGCCKISDFGISKKSDHALAYDHNSNMSLQGTIFWMAPEVFASTKGYSAKVDIWSLGCVVLEMFAGERPWNNLTDLAAMFKLGSEKKAPPIREDIVMSSEARNFLDQCFIIEPDDRPTAKQLLKHPFAQEDPNFHFKEYISIPGRT